MTKWLFIYYCPCYEEDPKGHRKHVRWIVVEDRKEAEILARSHNMPWPAESASTGYVEFQTVHNKVSDWEVYVGKRLRSKSALWRETFLKRLRPTPLLQ